MQDSRSSSPGAQERPSTPTPVQSRVGTPEPPAAGSQETAPLSSEEQYNAADLTSNIEEINIALEFVKLVREATLDNCGMDEEDLERLRHPEDPTDLLASLEDPGFRHALDSFLACSGTTADEQYTKQRTSYLRRHPESEMLSYDQIKRRVRKLTGIILLKTDMCVDSCVGFTGPFADLDRCPQCGEPRFDDRGGSRKQFSTFLLGPQIQAQFLNAEKARDLEYRVKITERLRAESTGGVISVDRHVDFVTGSAYWDAINSKKITDQSLVLCYSGDGAQLYRDKQSEIWLSIFAIFDFAPSIRYKVKSVLPDTLVPGPKAPGNHMSFLFPSIYHLSALQREGLKIWKADTRSFTDLDLFLAFATADAVAMAYLSCWVGHHGKHGCRFMCQMVGRRKPRGSHYYPAMLKPIGYTESGCDHDDIDIAAMPQASTTTYYDGLMKVIRSRNQTDYERNRRETGITRPSLFSALPNIYPLPGCFPADTLHQPMLNVPDLLFKLWRGSFERSDSDTQEWEWAVLVGDTWEQFGAAVAAAAEYLPGSFGRAPRNPFDKINSGFKACEWMILLYGFCPGLLYNILPERFWRHLCRLAKALRTVLSQEVVSADLSDAHKHFLLFAREFELLYYQRRIDRIHFVRQSIHAFTHLVPETLRIGPLSLVAQWLMERTIGNMGQEIRQHSTPYANLAQRALLRAEINALKAIFPDLEDDKAPLPQRSLDIGNGFALLRKRDRRPLSVRHYFQTTEVLEAIKIFLISTGDENLEEWTASGQKILRWARLRLPNGQTARSLWNETARKKTPRRARNVKVIYSCIYSNSSY